MIKQIKTCMTIRAWMMQFYWFHLGNTRLVFQDANFVKQPNSKFHGFSIEENVKFSYVQIKMCRE